MDYEEFRMIGKAISTLAENVEAQKNNVDEQLIIITDFFSWLQNNGGYILADTKTKHLKTQSNHIETYMTKWKISFQIIKIYKSKKCVNYKVKVM